MDYQKYLKINKTIAEQHRNSYKKRHEKDRHKINSNGYYADQILWN